MRILIDADGCPVVDIAIRIAVEKGIECLLICDTCHSFSKENATTITVSKGADSADFALVNLAQKGDIVVTQDYGLAAMALARNAFPISQNGLCYDDNNIESLLLSRHTAKKIRRAGGKLKGQPKRTDEQDKAFERELRELLAHVS